MAVVNLKIKTPKTKKPTGLTLVRNGNKFTLSWKQAETYISQEVKWESKAGTKTEGVLSVYQSLAFYPFGQNGGEVYPSKSTTVGTLKASVRAKGFPTPLSFPKASAWAPISYAIKLPKTPSLSVTKSEEYQFTSTFSWSVADAGATAATWFRRVRWESVLIKDCNTNDGAKVNWNDTRDKRTGTNANASYSVPIQETSSGVSNGSYTRWFRVRAEGPAGYTGWVYKRWVYAAPNAPTITSQKTKDATATTYSGECYWKTSVTQARPLTESTVRYVIATPTGINQIPLNPSWEALVTVGGASSSGAPFVVPEKCGTDEMMWYQVQNKYDRRTADSKAVPAAYGKLGAPEQLSVTPNQTTYRATVEATNTSQVPETFLVVVYKSTSQPEGFNVGVIESGQSSVTVQCPNWSADDDVWFGVYAAQGTYKVSGSTGGVSTYAVNAVMKSDIVWNGGAVPKYPTNVSIERTSIEGTVRVSWKWNWADATSAEISWSDHEDAWESTDEPQTYTITNLNASAWNITGLTLGQPWYVRVRMIATNGDTVTYGPYSETKSIDLSSAPAIPVLVLSNGVIAPTGSTTASWVYVTTDGTYQAFAEIAEVTNTGGVITYTKIAETKSEQHITLSASDLGWSAGETHALAVKVVSGSGRESDDWSVPVSLSIAEPMTATIASTSLVEKTIGEGEAERTVLSLTEMPLTLTITGAGDSDTTSVVIERADTYKVDRPDETDYTGYQGEAVYIYSQTGDDEITINREDLIGALDDDAAYTIVAMVQDGLGQSAEARLYFEVHWDHQAVMPEAEVVIEDTIAKITPIAPTGAEEGDTVDIYRLTADLPELIVEGGQFGTTYVDPYPAIGDFGGHRVVFKTKDGDYITEDKQLAWIDLGKDEGDNLDLIYSLIDFGQGEIRCLYDTSQSSSWEKDFKETRYLGGSIQGDWNPGVRQKASIENAMVTIEDQASIKLMHRLAAYPGICHIRTVNGTSFACDIQASENVNYDRETVRAEYSLNAVRIESQELDGMTLEEWNDLNGDE